MKQRNYLFLLCFLLATVAGFWPLNPVCAATNTLKKPILTKSGRNAAIAAAAEAIPMAMPGPEIDPTKIPHYFGPWPNYAHSQFTLPDAIVTFTPTDGNGSGAKATATVGANGAITGITITDPGSEYTSIPDVVITDTVGTNTSATAVAEITTTAAVTAINVNKDANGDPVGGAGYTAPVVTIAPPASGTVATATAYGGVDAVKLTAPGKGYTNPTVDFDLPDNPDGVPARAHAEFDTATGAITAIVVDQPGSGYSYAPNVVVRDGTIFDPINHDPGTFEAANTTATLTVQTVALNDFGAGYTAAPLVTIADSSGSGLGAKATAVTSVGGVTAINVTSQGSGYVTAGIKKFQDGLPGLCDPSVAGSCAAAANNLGQYIPLAVPDTTTFPGADYYVIALVQHRERMSSSLHGPGEGTLLRGYVQLSSPGVRGTKTLTNDLLNGGASAELTLPNGSKALAVDDPHFLGPIIIAQKDRPVRIVFYNLLPTGSDGDLFIPVDSTFMGAGMGPMMGMMDPMDEGSVFDMVRNPACGEADKNRMDCFAENRATLHLHGGITPWISDGSPHQWITPANEDTGWPEGVSVRQVPDMVGQAAINAGIPDCSDAADGCMTFYYTNQQSARLMFYHDHAWGITRLNVYAGEAAGYLITDDTEQALFGPSGTFQELGEGIPLVIQDRTFVPSAEQMLQQDPTWDYTRWGGKGDLWYEHVYMPAQNPGDPSGMSAYGRWLYGPWFWPPATPTYPPIANPYYDAACNLDDPTTWQYQTDPFCEPFLIPGTPNNSAGMEQFNDTPIVNGTAYPTITVEPKSYRLRILNAANDRFFNLQWYKGDIDTASTDLNSQGVPIGPTEVAFNPVELAAAQIDPNIFPTPVDASPADPNLPRSTAGPDWIQIGSEGGFLPAPVVVDGQQPTTWIIDPTRFDVGNGDKHSLLLAPAERADVIVDFSQFAGKTLILYNDAPAAFPARVASYDYYTGAPDLSPSGAPTILPGYGPNTRTIMQVKVAGSAAAPFNIAGLARAFKHHADGSGVFESGQNPIIVGQASYNSAYGTSFASAGDCNGGDANCDGYARISMQGEDIFNFDTLLGNRIGVKIEAKALHDETNATTFEPYGRMSGNLGVEAVPATPGLQNIVLYPFVNPPTELFDATHLPTTKDVTSTGRLIPIATGDDGTQIWKFTHNGVDTHPIHFHLYDVQVLNRVTWDNIIIAPDPNELGWKDTVRVSPLEDTYFAIRPVIPVLPWELPNSIRPLNPMMPLGDTTMFNPTDANGNPTNPIINSLANFGWEYMLHCHILSHEEMDMMRPVSVAVPPNAPSGLTWTSKGSRLTLTWTDNSINETEFIAQRNDGSGWINVGMDSSPLDSVNTRGGTRTITDTSYKQKAVYQYRVVAQNTIGYAAPYMSISAQSVSEPVIVGLPPEDPSKLTAVVQAGPNVLLQWRDNAANEKSFIIERSVNAGAFAALMTVAPRNGTGNVTYTDTSVTAGYSYSYRVAAANIAGTSGYSNTATVTLFIPAAPTNLRATAVPRGAQNARIILMWTDNANNETGFTIQRATNAAFTANLVTSTVRANVTSFTTGNVFRKTQYYLRVQAGNLAGQSAWVNVAPFPITTP